MKAKLLLRDHEVALGRDHEQLEERWPSSRAAPAELAALQVGAPADGEFSAKLEVSQAYSTRRRRGRPRSSSSGGDEERLIRNEEQTLPRSTQAEGTSRTITLHTEVGKLAAALREEKRMREEAEVGEGRDDAAAESQMRVAVLEAEREADGRWREMTQRRLTRGAGRAAGGGGGARAVEDGAGAAALVAAGPTDPAGAAGAPPRPPRRQSQRHLARVAGARRGAPRRPHGAWRAARGGPSGAARRSPPRRAPTWGVVRAARRGDGCARIGGRHSGSPAGVDSARAARGAPHHARMASPDAPRPAPAPPSPRPLPRPRWTTARPLCAGERGVRRRRDGAAPLDVRSHPLLVALDVRSAAAAAARPCDRPPGASDLCVVVGGVDGVGRGGSDEPDQYEWDRGGNFLNQPCGSNKIVRAR